MIYEKLLEFKTEIEARCGKVVRITLDKKGNEALRNELPVPSACKNELFGILIDQVSECPTCGQVSIKQ